MEFNKLLCYSCNTHVLEVTDEDLDDTGYYNVLECPNCNTKYKLYQSDNSIWKQTNKGYEPTTLEEVEDIIEINNRTVIHNGYFAYDNCHKIYILEDDTDIMQARELGYSILPITLLETTYNNSCSLRFISNWKLSERYVEQFAESVIFNIVEQ